MLLMHSLGGSVVVVVVVVVDITVVLFVVKIFGHGGVGYLEQTQFWV